MTTQDYKSQTHSIALDFINGHQSGWANKLESLIVNNVEGTIDDETTFKSLVNDVNNVVDNLFMPFIEENLYDILSEREVFNEQHWKNVCEQLTKAVKLFVSTKAEDIASDILDRHADDVQYNRSPARFFGMKNDDF